MTFKELSQQRSSVRDYCGRTVEEEKLEYVLECARLAPSAVNFQPWKVYVVGTDSTLRQKLQECYPRDWFKTAPMYLVCTILHGASWKRPHDCKDHGDIDIAILSEHICLAAAEQGLGTCWVCNFDAARCKQIMNLQEDEEAAVLIPIGYASEQYVPKEKKRKKLEEIVERDA